MKTNTYLGLISIQLAATNIQHNRLARQQAQRDEMQQQLAHDANEIAQNAHFAHWRQTPDGQHFERWRHAALDITAVAHDRNHAWAAIREATLASEIANSAEPAIDNTDLRKHMLAYGITAGVFWLLSFILVGVSPEPGTEGPMTYIVGVCGALAIAATTLLIVTSRKPRKRHEEAHRSIEHTAHARALARYGQFSSWHTAMTGDQIHDAIVAINDTIARGHRNFPAPTELQQLRPLLDTRIPDTFPNGLPNEAHQLLDVFARENREKATQLEAARLS